MSKREDYAKYINSDVWKGKRKRALERAGYRCQVCNKKDGSIPGSGLHVHHRTYERFGGGELPMDLTVLCVKCHYLFHSSKPGRHHKPAKRRNLADMSWAGRFSRARDCLQALQVHGAPATSRTIGFIVGEHPSFVGSCLARMRAQGELVMKTKHKCWRLTPAGEEWLSSFDPLPDFYYRTIPKARRKRKGRPSKAA